MFSRKLVLGCFLLISSSVAFAMQNFVEDQPSASRTTAPAPKIEDAYHRFCWYYEGTVSGGLTELVQEFAEEKNLKFSVDSKQEIPVRFGLFGLKMKKTGAVVGKTRVPNQTSNVVEGYFTITLGQDKIQEIESGLRRQGSPGVLIVQKFVQQGGCLFVRTTGGAIAEILGTNSEALENSVDFTSYDPPVNSTIGDMLYAQFQGVSEEQKKALVDSLNGQIQGCLERHDPDYEYEIRFSDNTVFSGLDTIPEDLPTISPQALAIAPSSCVMTNLARATVANSATAQVNIAQVYPLSPSGIQTRRSSRDQQRVAAIGQWLHKDSLSPLDTPTMHPLGRILPLAKSKGPVIPGGKGKQMPPRRPSDDEAGPAKRLKK